MTSLKNKIESILFVASKPLTKKALTKILETGESEIALAASELAAERKDSGVVILEGSDGYQMATSSEHSKLVKDFLNADLREKLTDATVEVLAIVAYRQPISKSELEAIRGVNSQYSLRQLLMRGLIERTPDPHDGRAHLYQVTTEFMQHMGLSKAGDLPEFESLVSQIKLPDVPQAQPEEAPSEPSDEVIKDPQ